MTFYEFCDKHGLRLNLVRIREQVWYGYLEGPESYHIRRILGQYEQPIHTDTYPSPARVVNRIICMIKGCDLVYNSPNGIVKIFCPSTLTCGRLK